MGPGGRSSDEATTLSSPKSWSRNAADSSASEDRLGRPRGDVFTATARSLMCGMALTAVQAMTAVRRRFFGPDCGADGAFRSGASMSSSPAMPTNVNRA